MTSTLSTVLILLSYVSLRFYPLRSVMPDMHWLQTQIKLGGLGQIIPKLASFIVSNEQGKLILFLFICFLASKIEITLKCYAKMLQGFLSATHKD